MDKKSIKKTFSHQQDQSDCGVACLLSVLRFHGGYRSLESLRELSGTSKQGTTLLGLYQAAQNIGFKTTGYEADFEHLQKLKAPSILHVILENRLQHYVVCYGYQNGKYTIGDPGKGILELSELELAEIWISKSLLELLPTENLEQITQVNQEKWNWFKSILQEDAGLLTIIFGLSMIFAILGMAMAVFSQKLIDDILPSKNIGKLLISLVLITFLLTARGGIGYIAGHFAIRQGRDFNNRLIARFFSCLVYLPKSFFDNRRIGELVERMNDTSRIQTAIAGIVTELLKNFLLVIVGEVVLFIYSPFLGTISLISLPIFGLISWRYHKAIIRAQWNVMAANAHKSSNYVDSMNGIATIKSNHKEKEFSSLNQMIYGFYQDKLLTLGKVGISLQLIAEIASVLITVTLLSSGSWMIIAGKLTIGELMAVLGITNGIFPAIVSLAFANITLQGAKVAFDRMYEFSAIRPEFEKESAEKADPFENILTIEVKDLSFRFPGRKQLLKDISLILPKGKMIALLGESGCGKTTFLNILQRFYEPERGEISVNGSLLERISIPAWRKQTGVVPQEVNLFNGTLIYNICLSTHLEDVQRCFDFCTQSGLHNYFMEFPQNYSTLLGEQGINISGGQKQLVGLARALWRDPGFLILDEPTSAMDRNTENFVLNLLHKIRNTKCIILVTHRIKVAHNCDLICILENGSIQSAGNHDDLMSNVNLYSMSFSELTTSNSDER